MMQHSLWLMVGQPEGRGGGDHLRLGKGLSVAHQVFAVGPQVTPDAEDIAQAVLFAVTQPPKARVFMIGMRPMSEPL